MKLFVKLKFESIQIFEEIQNRKLKEHANLLDYLVDICCEFWGVTRINFASKSQKGDFVNARRTYCYFAVKYKRALCNKHLANRTIGSKCNIAHSTVDFHCNSVKGEMQVNKSFTRQMTELEYRIINQLFKKQLYEKKN
jgi:chromosomal replication initiation ATPase DnaA